MGIIEKNFKGTVDSFIGKLHEKEEFCIVSLNDLIFEICSLVKKRVCNILSDSELIFYMSYLFNIYSYAQKSICSHYDKDDLFKIKNFDPIFDIYIERLCFVIKCLLSKDYKSIEAYIDELGKF